LEKLVITGKVKGLPQSEQTAHGPRRKKKKEKGKLLEHVKDQGAGFWTQKQGGKGRSVQLQ